MALIRFIFQSSILASTMLTGFLIYINPAQSKSDGSDVSLSLDNTNYYDGSMIFRVPEKMDLDRVPLLNVSTSMSVFQFWNLSELK